MGTRAVCPLYEFLSSTWAELVSVCKTSFYHEGINQHSIRVYMLFAFRVSKFRGVNH